MFFPTPLGYLQAMHFTYKCTMGASGESLDEALGAPTVTETWRFKGAGRRERNDSGRPG